MAMVRAIPIRSANMPHANLPSMPPRSVMRTADAAHPVGIPFSIIRNATKVRKPLRVELSRAAMAPSDRNPPRCRIPQPFAPLAALFLCSTVGRLPLPAACSNTKQATATTTAVIPYPMTGACQETPIPVARMVRPMNMNLPTSPKEL